MDENLKEFGYNFQTKVITSILTDKQFFDHINDILYSEYFDSDSLNWIHKSIKIYYNEYHVLPTLDVFKVQLQSVKIELHKQEIINSLKQIYKQTASDDLEYVKNEIISFCKNQLIKKAILNSVDYLEKGNFDAIKNEIDNALKISQSEKNLGIDYINDVEYRYTEEAEVERIPTGWEPLDELMNGGLPIGKMGIIMAPTGIGKSWCLAYLGAHAIKMGYDVLHYTLELDEIYVAKRYDGILTKIPMEDLKYNIGELKRRLSNYKGSLHIKYFPPGTITLNDLRVHIEKYLQINKKPKLVILDYPELLKLNFNNGIREDKVLGELYKDLRGLAGEKEFALWAVDQTNRSGVSKDIIEGDSVSNSFAKLFAVDLLMTLSRRPKDKLNNTARFFVSKNRLGPDGIAFPSTFDTTKCVIELYNDQSEKGIKTKSDMLSNEEYERREMVNIYDKYKKNLI